jgi:hypothetical protein
MYTLNNKKLKSLNVFTITATNQSDLHAIRDRDNLIDSLVIIANPPDGLPHRITSGSIPLLPIKFMRKEEFTLSL